MSNKSIEPKITPEMIAAGVHAISCTVGGADLGGYFEARELALEVYRAMWNARPKRSSRPERPSDPCDDAASPHFGPLWFQDQTRPEAIQARAEITTIFKKGVS